MSHGVHAVQHEVEHRINHDDSPGKGHGHKPAENHNKKIALLIAVIALFLAFSETLGKARRPQASSSTSRHRIPGTSSRPRPSARPRCARPPKGWRPS
jgi:hypothetical protein